MQSRYFEVPYNFDKEIIEYLDNIADKNKTFVFMPTFFEDGYDTRYNRNNKDLYPKTRIEYEEHISYIKNKGFSISILMQDKIFNENIIQYYIDLGIKRFIVRFDQTAKIIRSLSSEATVVASITQRLNYEDICNLDDKLYDEIVLFFPFNRNYPILKKLPKKYKYILLTNTQCSTDCPAIHHWYGNGKVNDKPLCFADNKNFINVIPEHLSLFDDYIYCFKLQGRECTTQAIIEAIKVYFEAKKCNLNDPIEKKSFFDKYGKYEYFRVKDEYSGENYNFYNFGDVNCYIKEENNLLRHYSTEKNNPWFYDKTQHSYADLDIFF